MSQGIAGNRREAPDLAVAGSTCVKKNSGAVGLEEDVRTCEREEKNGPRGALIAR